jgi:hypothetical protein
VLAASRFLLGKVAGQVLCASVLKKKLFPAVVKRVSRPSSALMLLLLGGALATESLQNFAWRERGVIQPILGGAVVILPLHVQNDG